MSLVKWVDTSAMIAAETTPVSSCNSLMAADFGSSPSSMPPCNSFF